MVLEFVEEILPYSSTYKVKYKIIIIIKTTVRKQVRVMSKVNSNN